MDKCTNNEMAEALRKYQSRRENKNKSNNQSDDVLDPAAFTHFMGCFHDHKQENIKLTAFTAPERMKK